MRSWILVLACAGCLSADDDGADGGDGKGDSPLPKAIVYFSPGDTDPQYHASCYAGDTRAARTKLLAQEQPGVTGLTATISGATLIAKYKFFEQPYTTKLARCPFSVADTARTVSCRVQLGDTYAGVQELGDYTRQLDLQWRALTPPSAVVDCARAKARNITNTWQQRITVSHVKTLRALLGQGVDIQLHCPIIRLASPAGLEREQQWSASVTELELMTPTLCAEVGDASLTQISVDGERSAWIEQVGNWTPWNIRVVALQCDGFAPMANPAHVAELDLDRTAASFRAHCP
jgi:hypothetical protein